MAWDERYSRGEVEAAVRGARCWADVLRALGLPTAGGNRRTVQRWATRWGLDVSHFDPNAARAAATSRRARPLVEVLVAGGSASRHHIKRRLYAEGVKKRRCEACGQGEEWRGRRMALILDHINGIPDDHRLENLQILCPNCAATLDTHCGRNLPAERACAVCGERFAPRTTQARFCGVACSAIGRRGPRPADPAARRVARPPLEQLLEEVAEGGFSAVGRRYGVSDNAARKWVRTEQARRALAGSGGGTAGRPGAG